MDPRLLSYYNRELEFMREMGGEFAREFPKIAGRLGLDTLEVADPYVERLLEGFAFLAARVQLKLDDEYPRFTQHLLQMVYPHYLAPTPSMAIIQLRPNLAEGSLASGFVVPRRTAVKSRLSKGQQTPCEFRTAHDITLWPLEVVRAEYSTYLGDLTDARGVVPNGGAVRASLRLTLASAGGLKFSDLALDRLPIFLGGDGVVAGRLYEQLTGHVTAVVVRPAPKSNETARGARDDGQKGAGKGTGTGQGAWRRVVSRTPVSAMGFAEDEALLPPSPRSFEGYRLLHEYFALPSRYLFAELADLQTALMTMSTSEIELMVLFDAADARLDNSVDTGNTQLFCTPAINLFPQRADRIHLTQGTCDYHVVVDRTRPQDYEVYDVTEVLGYGAGNEAERKFSPFYALGSENIDVQRASYYTVRRQPRKLPTTGSARAPRSSYVGSEIFMALVDGDEGPYKSDLKQLAIQTWCTNRDLPLHLVTGLGRTDFTLESGAPVESIRCLVGPTPPRESMAHGSTAWRLISHLTLNYLSLTDTGGSAAGSATGGSPTGAAALRELLTLYADLGDASSRRQIEGLLSVKSAPIVRRLPLPGPVSFGRGLGVTLVCDEDAFVAPGICVLGAVLERFFAKYVSINSFVETTLQTVQRGEVMRWPATCGTRRLL